MQSWAEYVSAQSTLLMKLIDGKVLLNLVDSIVNVGGENQSMIFTAGNGGSATTADHFAADLSQSKKRVGVPLRAICLNSQLGINSALSNDLSYDLALSKQLENFPSGNHKVIVFSASGNSRNLINLLKAASILDYECWAFLGFDGGEISAMSHVNLILFEDSIRDYGAAENAHLVACHFVVDRVLRSLTQK